jgi:mono/diheme cytochrome c family protein
MRTLKKCPSFLPVVALAVAALTMIVVGCSSTARTPAQPADPPGSAAGAPAATGVAAPAAADAAVVAAAPPSGSQLWAERCGQCHNIRDPGSYSAAQWRVAVHHMRFRAFLTGQEERAITEFLTAK